MRRRGLPTLHTPHGPSAWSHARRLRAGDQPSPGICGGESGQIIGVLVLVANEEMMLLDNVAVHPDRQGLGLGRQLMAFAENEAAKQGYSSLELYTHESMTENIGL